MAALPALAMLPAAAVPLAESSDDPIFAAIERHRAVYAAHIAGVEADLDDHWHEASSNAEIGAAMALVADPPTTLAGAAALTAYALEYKLSDLSWPDTGPDDFAAALLRSLNSTLSGGAMS